jgi:hypothetical protein
MNPPPLRVFRNRTVSASPVAPEAEAEATPPRVAEPPPPPAPAVSKAPRLRPGDPVSRVHDLPAVPLTRTAKIPEASVNLGRLTRQRAANGRPFVTIAVTCELCRVTRFYPWRWDWGLDPQVVSYQYRRCLRRKGHNTVWLALDPALAAANAAVHQAAREDFVKWTADRAAQRAAKLAASTPTTS